jgi:hypothetical protein
MRYLNTLLSRRAFGIVLFSAFFLLWMFLAKVSTHSWQEDSRMGTVQALVEQGTFAIEATEFSHTGDKVFIDGHFYSDKMPLLSVATAGVYSILRHALGLTLDAAVCAPKKDAVACRAFTPAGTRFTAFYWLTLIFMGLSASGLVVLFWRAMLNAGATGFLAAALAVALGVASPIAPYSTVFAGHVPAALCLFAGFYLLVRSVRAERYTSPPVPNAPVRSRSNVLRRLMRSRFFYAGLLLGLAANIDLMLTLFVAAFGLWILVSRREHLVAYLSGALAPFVLTALLTYWAAGRFVPLYLDPSAYDYPGSALKPAAGGTVGFYSLEFGIQYAYNMLIGRRGVLAFTPLLIFAGLGVATAIRANKAGLRGLTTSMVGATLAFVTYLILRTDNYGGVAWGIRWLVPLIPVWWYYLPTAYDLVRTRKFAFAGLLLFWGLLVLSFLSVLPGLQDAWATARPIVRL